MKKLRRFRTVPTLRRYLCDLVGKPCAEILCEPVKENHSSLLEGPSYFDIDPGASYRTYRTCHQPYTLFLPPYNNCTLGGKSQIARTRSGQGSGFPESMLGRLCSPSHVKACYPERCRLSFRAFPSTNCQTDQHR